MRFHIRHLPLRRGYLLTDTQRGMFIEIAEEWLATSYVVSTAVDSLKIGVDIDESEFDFIVRFVMPELNRDNAYAIDNDPVIS